MGGFHRGDWQAELHAKVDRDREDDARRAAATPAPAKTLNLSPSEYRRARNPGNHIERATFNRYWRED